MDNSVNLKVGDRVRVLRHIPDYAPYGVNEDMRKFQGMDVTIERVLSTNVYELEEDENKWSWANEMFEGFAEPDGSIGSCLRSGNICVLKDGKEMLCTGTSLRSPKGFSLSLDHYRGEDHRYTNIHDENDKFEIMEVYAQAENSNYLFEKGELIWKSEE